MKALFAILLFSSFALQNGTIDVGGAKFSKKLSVDGNTLILNGTGIRTKWFIDLYATGLYLKRPSVNATEIIESDSVQVIKIVIISSLITTEKFNDAIDEAFDKSTNNNTSALGLDKDIAALKKALGINLTVGTEFMFVQNKSKGLLVYRDKKYKTTLKGPKFKKELLKLWIGPRCINDELKYQLLGKE